MTEQRQLYTVRQVSQVFQVTEKSIRDWCTNGYFPSAQKLGRGAKCHWRIPSDDAYLSEFMDTNRISIDPQVADRDQQIAQLQQQVLEMDAKFNHLMSVYNGSLKEQDQLEATIQTQQGQITELQKYKDHYDQQRELRRSGGRRKAA